MNGHELTFWLRMNTKQFLNGSKKAQKSYQKLHKDISSKPLNLKSTGNAQLLKQFVGISAAIVGIRKVFDDMTTSQTNLANIASLGVKNIDELKKGIQDIAVDTPVALHDLEEGLYDVVSAGVAAADQIEVLELSAKAAKAGLSETSEALKLGSAVIKGYGMEWSDFNDVMDLAFQTVKLGQTTFPELAASMGKVIPLAAKLGVETEALFGAMATLTGVTGNAAEVATQLRGVLAATVKPTAELTALFSDYESASEALRDLGMPEYLRQMSERTDGNIDAMVKLVPRVEGLNAVLALSGEQFDTFVEKTDAMRDSAGAMAGAFETQAETLDSKLTQLDNTFQVFADQILHGVIPPLTALIELVSGVMKVFTELDPVTQKIILGGTTLAIVLAKLPAIIRLIQASFIALRGAMGPIAILITVIGVAAAAWENYADEADRAKKSNVELEESFNDLTEATRKHVAAMLEDKSLEELNDLLENYKNHLEAARLSILNMPKDHPGLERQIRLYERNKGAIQAVEEAIKAKRKVEIELTTGLTETELKELDKRQAHEFKRNRLSLENYIIYLESRSSALEANSLKLLQHEDKIHDLKQQLLVESFVTEIELRRLNKEEIIGIGDEETAAYVKNNEEKKKTDAELYHAKLELAAEGAQATIELGAKLMGAFQGQSKALFNIGRAAAKAKALINAHEAASINLAKYPFPFGAIMASIAYGLGIARVAAISNVKFKGKALGGLITSNDIASSAFTPSGEDGLIGAQVDEFVMNKKSTAQFLPILEQMNAKQTIPGYATGGQVNEVAAIQNESVINKNVIEVKITGELRGEGREIVAVIKEEEEAISDNNIGA